MRMSSVLKYNFTYVACISDKYVKEKEYTLFLVWTKYVNY